MVKRKEMKREIKFRFWSGTKMFYDIENVLECLKQQTYHNEGFKPPHGFDHVGEENSEFMQFTGLKDKNGKEIYEGDICRVLYTDWGSKSDNDPRSIAQYIHDISKVCVVEFIDYEWVFNFGPNRYGEIGYGSFHVGAHGFVELVGNILENPELIDFNITE